MAAAKMRHFNSPEEVARRQNEPVTSKGKEFRHYNHPEEVAKRAAAGQKAAAVVVPPRVTRAHHSPEQWPPAGEPNNAPVETPAVVVDAPPATPNEKPDTVPPPAMRGDREQRLRRLEDIVFTLVESVAESRHFRMLLNNQQAVTESQQDLVNRVRALEHTLDQVLEEEGDDADDAPAVDAGSSALQFPGDVPTRDDNGQPEGA